MASLTQKLASSVILGSIGMMGCSQGSDSLFGDSFKGEYEVIGEWSSTREMKDSFDKEKIIKSKRDWLGRGGYDRFVYDGSSLKRFKGARDGDKRTSLWFDVEEFDRTSNFLSLKILSVKQADNVSDTALKFAHRYFSGLYITRNQEECRIVVVSAINGEEANYLVEKK